MLRLFKSSLNERTNGVLVELPQDFVPSQLSTTVREGA